jgi:hypothetical protein
MREVGRTHSSDDVGACVNAGNSREDKTPIMRRSPALAKRKTGEIDVQIK